MPLNRPLAFGGRRHTEALVELARRADTALGKQLHAVFEEHKLSAAKWGEADPATVVQGWIQMGFLVGAYMGKRRFPQQWTLLLSHTDALRTRPFQSGRMTLQIVTLACGGPTRRRRASSTAAMATGSTGSL